MHNWNSIHKEWAEKQQDLNYLKQLKFFEKKRCPINDAEVKRSKEKLSRLLDYFAKCEQQGFFVLYPRQFYEEHNNQLNVLREKFENNFQNAKGMRFKIEKEIENQEEQINDLDNFKPIYNDLIIQEKINDMKNQIKQHQAQRMNEIKKLNVIVFASIQLKNKDLDSPIHQLWIWAIKMLYAQQPSNYEWQNFKEQVFSKDKGEDFKTRLERTRVVNLKKEESDCFLLLLNKKQQILSQPQLKPAVRNEVDQLFRIIELMSKMSSLSDQIAQNQVILEGNSKEREKNVELRRKLCDKKQYLVEILQQYLVFEEKQYKILEELRRLIQTKEMERERISAYYQKIKDQCDNLSSDQVLFFEKKQLQTSSIIGFQSKELGASTPERNQVFSSEISSPQKGLMSNIQKNISSSMQKSENFLKSVVLEQNPIVMSRVVQIEGEETSKPNLPKLEEVMNQVDNEEGQKFFDADHFQLNERELHSDGCHHFGCLIY